MVDVLKRCFKCKRLLPRDCFYHHAKMADGLLGKCKDCAKADARRTRRERIEHYRHYDRGRKNRISDNRYRTFEKQAANRAVHYAVKQGKLSRPARCKICGDRHLHIHGHHEDYSQKLEVVWCCPPCHAVLDGRTKD